MAFCLSPALVAVGEIGAVWKSFEKSAVTSELSVDTRPSERAVSVACRARELCASASDAARSDH